jgi:predicted adenylyl cyclase CyaB
MAANTEIKAYLKDPRAAHKVAQSLSGGPAQIIKQEDIFYHVPKGSLKLRLLSETSAQLVAYEREDLKDGIRASNYVVYPTTTPKLLRELLNLSLPVRGVVKKTRHLYMVGNTQVHIDDVENLGTFLEFEVVLKDGQTHAEGQVIAAGLMKKFSITQQDLIAVKYMDLLERKNASL